MYFKKNLLFNIKALYIPVIDISPLVLYWLLNLCWGSLWELNFLWTRSSQQFIIFQKAAILREGASTLAWEMIDDTRDSLGFVPCWNVNSYVKRSAGILKKECRKCKKVYVELQDQWNGPYFFLKKSYLSPRCPKLPDFFSQLKFSHNIYMS